MIRRATPLSPAAILAAGVLLSSCAGAIPHVNPFAVDWEDDQGISIDREWQQLANVPSAHPVDVVVAVTARASDTVIGRPLDGGPLWTLRHPVDVRPIVAGALVVVSGGGDVVAADARTGAVVWHQPTGNLRLLGAGDDGAVTAMTFLQAGGKGGVLLAVGRDGTVVQQIETRRTIGAPAVLKGVAFIPWDGQYVSAINLRTGNEDARVTLRDVTSRAWIEGGALWFGETTFSRFDERIHDASRGAASVVRLPTRELPGIPRRMPAGGSPTLPQSSAEDKMRLYARPMVTPSGGDFSNHRYYATYFRLAIGFDTPSGTLAWVHRHSSDLIGGAAAEGGVVLCDERGRVTELDAKTGGVLREIDLGEAVQSCVVSADALSASGPPGPVRSLAAQLADAVLAEDPQLVVAQKLMLKELAASEDPIATQALVALVSDPRTSVDVAVLARELLPQRRNGAPFMLAALERHYDFLKDVLRPPPVGPLAQALGAMKSKAAAPLLAAHLLDPADTDDDIRQAAAALAVVAGPSELPALRQFFGMYRASCVGNEDLAEAVVSVAQAMLEVGDRTARAQVEAAAADPTTVPYAAERLRSLVGTSSESSPADSGTAPGSADR